MHISFTSTAAHKLTLLLATATASLLLFTGASLAQILEAQLDDCVTVPGSTSSCNPSDDAPEIPQILLPAAMLGAFYLAKRSRKNALLKKNGSKSF